MVHIIWSILFGPYLIDHTTEAQQIMTYFTYAQKLKMHQSSARQSFAYRCIFKRKWYKIHLKDFSRRSKSEYLTKWKDSHAAVDETLPRIPLTKTLQSLIVFDHACNQLCNSELCYNQFYFVSFQLFLCFSCSTAVVVE